MATDTQPTLFKRKKFYKKYDEHVIEKALKEYEESKKSFKIIADKHNIPKSVLHRHYTRFTKKQGGQTALSPETEKYIIKYLNICSEWGYPLDPYDLRLLVKDYLDRTGITVKKFRDNMPGPDFVKSFLSRNKQDLSLRLSQNIKRARAAISPEKINQYFDELELSLDGVPLCNLVNYDETNLSDDPGRRKIICKRGAKYPERVLNHSKGSISLMIAAAADGALLPPYVVYKSQHLYDTWTTGGPKGCRYNRINSGWFDGHTFEEWVRTVIYSYFKDKTGKKLLIGDNLSSHLSIDLIRECKERDIHFVFLPSNSTHLTQPLDVAFFRPMKIAWRDILFHWKKTDGRVQATFPKPLFPQLLKKLLQRLDDNAKQNILSGFSKAGISPLNRKRVLDRLPNNYERDDSIFSKENVDVTVLNMLKEMRYGTGTIKVCNKKKKLNVIPGKSVGSESDYADTDTESSRSHNDKKRKVATETKVNKIDANAKREKSMKNLKVEVLNENHNIQESNNNAAEVEKKAKGKGIGKKSVKVREEQKKQGIKEKELNRKLNEKQEEITSYENIFTDDFDIDRSMKNLKVEVLNENHNIQESNNNAAEVEKKVKGKGIGKKSVKMREEQKKEDIKEMELNRKLNEKQEEISSYENIFTDDFDINNMPVLFEVVIDDSIPKNKEPGSEIKILSNEKVSHINLSKDKLHLTKVSLTDPIKGASLKKRRKYACYRNEEEILCDLMETDSE